MPRVARSAPRSLANPVAQIAEPAPVAPVVDPFVLQVAGPPRGGASHPHVFFPCALCGAPTNSERRIGDEAGLHAACGSCRL